MIRTVLFLFPLLCLAVVAAPRPARADDKAPCSDEAEAVRKMKRRDPALAYPKNASAKEHLEAGKRAFGVQEYDKAIEEYTSAGLVDDAPLILYNLGQTYRAANEYEKAIRQYELFIERGKPGKQVTALVECHIATMQSELDHAAATAPPSGPEAEPSGPTAERPDGPVVEDDRTDEPRHRARPSRWTGTRKVAIGLAVLGAGGLTAGTVFAIQGQGLKDDARRLCPSSPCGDADEANALTERADTKVTLANVSFGVGAAAVVGAVVLWFVGAPTVDDGESGAALIPQVGPGFAGVAYGGRF